MGSFCGSTTTTQSTQQGSQSGQSQNNLLPQLQAAAQQLQGQYSNLGSVGANQYQTGAANAQQGVAGNLTPGYQAAAGVAQNGITPGSISQYMSPYISNVVQAYNQQQDLNDAQSLGQLGASAAKVGALTASTAPGAEALARSQLQSQRNLNTANLLNSGYGQAANLAQQNVNAQLQGAGTLGSLVGANTGANAGLGQLGQGVFASNLAPYTLASQQAQSTAQLASPAGQSYSGQSTGSSNGTQTANEPLFSSILGGVGLWGNANNYAQNNGGWGSTLASFLPFNEGGSVEDPSEQLANRFHALKKAFRSGGSVDGYADGGWVTSVEKEPQASIGSIFSDGAKSFSAQPQDTSALRNQQASLSNFMSNMGPPKMADGGVPPYLAQEPGWSPVKPLSQQQQFFNGLMSASRLTAPIAQNSMDMQKQRLEEEQQKRSAYMQAQQLAQQAAIAAGKVNVNGQMTPTLAAQSQPSEIELRQAQAQAARTGSDKQFLLDIEKQKMEYQKQLQLEQQEKEWQLLERLRKQRQQTENGARGPALQPNVVYEQYLKPDGTVGVRPAQQ